MTTPIERYYGRYIIMGIIAAMFGFSNDAPAAQPAQDKAKDKSAALVWPNTTAPTDDGVQAISDGYTQYKKSEVAPGKWQWVVNKEVMKYMADEENHRRELYWALRSRVLTDAEMAEVKNYGDRLNIEAGHSFMPEEKSRELNDALLQQYRIRQVDAGKAAP